jgi:hypothetical protein
MVLNKKQHFKLALFDNENYPNLVPRIFSNLEN